MSYFKEDWFGEEVWLGVLGRIKDIWVGDFSILWFSMVFGKDV